jgi:hypothetical protein
MTPRRRLSPLSREFTPIPFKAIHFLIRDAHQGATDQPGILKAKTGITKSKKIMSEAGALELQVKQ